MPECGKHPHFSRKKAISHLLRLKAKGVKGSESGDMGVYRCDCGAWHTGHKQKRSFIPKAQRVKDIDVLTEDLES